MLIKHLVAHVVALKHQPIKVSSKASELYMICGLSCLCIDFFISVDMRDTSPMAGQRCGDKLVYDSS